MDETVFRDTVAPWAGVTLAVKWRGFLVASLGTRMFAVFMLRGRDAGSLSFKVPDDDFLGWTGRPGVQPAPYLARARWVMLPQPAHHDPAVLTDALRTAHGCIAARLTSRERQRLGLA